MELEPLASAPPRLEPDLLRAPASLPPTLSSAQEFEQVLGRFDVSQMDEKARARAGAEQLLSVALVQPVLKSLRGSNRAAAPFAPSQGERTFRAMMDTSLAQNLVKSGNWGLVDRVAQALLRNTSPDAKAAEPSVSELKPLRAAAT
jgi:Rod binding domain-containing protein